MYIALNQQLDGANQTAIRWHPSRSNNIATLRPLPNTYRKQSYEVYTSRRRRKREKKGEPCLSVGKLQRPCVSPCHASATAWDRHSWCFSCCKLRLACSIRPYRVQCNHHIALASYLPSIPLVRPTSKPFCRHVVVTVIRFRAENIERMRMSAQCTAQYTHILTWVFDSSSSSISSR